MADGSSKFKNSINLEPQSADPSNPAEGDTFCSDGTSRAAGYWQYINGAWSEFGGGKGGINYLAGDNSDAENGIGDWVTYADAAGENAVDGTGGTALGVTLTQNTTDPLREDADFKFSKDAADRQGEGASVAFTIDKADKAQKLTISFDYDASDANYADDDIRIAIYDVTNANLIRVNGEDLKGGKGTHIAQFQTAADSTSYRLIIHQSSTNATAYDVYLDNISVGPNSVINAPEIGEVGEILTMAADVTVQGPYLYCDGTAVSRTTYSELFDAVGTTYGVGDGSTTFNLPDYRGYFLRGLDTTEGVDPDFATRTLGSSQADELKSHRHDLPEGSASGDGIYISDSAPTLQTNVAKTAFFGGAETRPKNYAVKYYIRTRTDRVVATVGGGRDVHLRANRPSGGSFASGATIPFTTVVNDTTSSYNTSTGEFTIPETGIYSISSTVRPTTSGDLSLSINVNGSPVSSTRDVDGQGNSLKVVEEIFLNKNDVVEIVNGTISSFTLSTNNTQNTISITKLASPQTILETETVAARYTSNSGQSIADSTEVTILYEDLVADTHNAYNTSTGIYTVPISGWYQINAFFTLANSATVAGNQHRISLHIDNVLTERIISEFSGTNASNSTAPTLSTLIYLNKSQEVELKAFQSSGAAATLIPNDYYNVFSIARIK